MKTVAVAVNKVLAFPVEVIYFLSFVIPFIFDHPQLLTGTVVNTLLYVAAAKMDRKMIIPVIAVPSLATVLHGVVFGAFTPFLLFFIPFIWIGNFMLVEVFKLERFNPVVRVVLAAGLKAVFLFLIANIYVSLRIVPGIFLTAMGVFQFATAVLGGLAAVVILKMSVQKKEASVTK